MGLSDTERSRYARHLVLAELGASGQERLKAARVLMVGAGGLGSPAALYLAAAGVGTLGLLDADQVELSNLQRQILFDTSLIGQPKATAGAAQLARLNPDIRVIPHQLQLRAANALELIGAYDLVLDGTDRLATRYVVNDACVLLRVPLVSAAIHRFEGQLFTYLPGRGPCYRCLFAQASDATVANCATAGVLGVLPGVIGALQATEALKLIAGIGSPLSGRLLTYDALDMRFSEFRLQRRPDCAVCGDTPSIHQPQDPPSMSRPGDTPDIRHLSAPDLQGLLKSAGNSPPPLIDVREVHEFDAGHLRGSVNIPLGQLPGRLGEIAAASAPVFICRSGGRSFAACQMALAAHIASPANLEGGLLGWAAQVDPALRVA